MDKIKCPHCGKQVELSEAIVHELQAQVRDEESKKLKAQFEEEKAKESAIKEKQLREEFEKQNKDRELALIEAKKKEEILLEKMANDAEERKKSEDKIREEVSKQVSDKARLEKLEFEKKIDDMQKALEEAQRKGKQGSQQLQGEVLELDFEQKLKETFPNDEFVPIPKGVEGADIWQKIKFRGETIGSIIWETKRTKTWDKKWPNKLKEDAGKVSATEAIITSSVLPEGVINFDRQDGVWITTYEHAVSVCRMVRFLITSVSSAKSSASRTEEEWESVRDYMMGDEFMNKMRLHFQNIKLLKDMLDSDIRTTTAKWKRQEGIIKKLDSNTSSFYGELQAIVPNLPDIKDNENILADGEDEATLF